MKNKLLELFICMLLVGTCFIVALNTVSADYYENGYYYTVNNGEATIVNYNGPGGAITIPSTLGGYPTVAIGDFGGEMNGDYVFQGGPTLTSVIIPDSVRYIGVKSFRHQHTLTSVGIGNGVTTIAERAFFECDHLTSLTIGKNVTTIGNHVFSYCSSLPFVNLPNSVTTIGVWAFHACSSLTSINVPRSVTSIGDGAFTLCSSLNAINVDASNVNYASINGVLYTKAKTTLTCYPGAKAGSFNIPSSVTKIKNSAFTSCISLTSVTIPNSVTTILDSAFSSCSSLNSINFLGLAAPTTVGANWISGTPVEIRGHAYAASNFPAPGGIWNGLTMGTYLQQDQTQILDQQQTQYNLNYAMYSTRWGGQRFIPTTSPLSSVDLYMRRIGNPPSSVTLSVRSSLTGSDLVSIILSTSQIPTSYGWVKFDFNDLPVIPGSSYYLVLRTSGGSSSNCYYWGYGYQTSYTIGIRVYSSTGGVSWINNPSYDCCFKTYGTFF